MVFKDTRWGSRYSISSHLIAIFFGVLVEYKRTYFRYVAELSNSWCSLRFGVRPNLGSWRSPVVLHLSKVLHVSFLAKIQREFPVQPHWTWIGCELDSADVLKEIGSRNYCSEESYQFIWGILGVCSVDDWFA